MFARELDEKNSKTDHRAKIDGYNILRKLILVKFVNESSYNVIVHILFRHKRLIHDKLLSKILNTTAK